MTGYAGRESKIRDAWLRAVLENTSDVICVLDEEGTLLYVSPAIESVLGYPPEDLIGKLGFGHVHTEDAAFVAMSFAEITRTPGVHAPVAFRVRAADGSLRYVEAVPNNRLDDPVSGVVVTFRDLTERAQAEEEVRFHARLLDAVGQAVIAVDLRGRIVYWNKAAEESYGWSAEEAAGRSVLEAALTEQALGRREEIMRRMREGRSWSGEFELRRKDGTLFPVMVTTTPVLDELDDLVCIIGVSTDITERKALEEELRQRATHDRLTGLPNRQLFTDRLHQALERTKRRKSMKVAILFMDLDGFKIINDSLGHDVGDKVLVVVAERLRRCLRPEDTLSRFGGDEFVVLLEEVGSPNEAARVAERIIEELNRPVLLEDWELFVSISIGIGLGDAREKSPEHILRDADIAMYRSKGEGSGYRLFGSAMYEAGVTRLDRQSELGRAVELGEFVLHYQPMIWLRTGDIIGVEALARWKHPEQGLLAPSEFIPISEETGAVVSLGRWVLKEACRQAKEWQDRYPEDPPLSMSLNLSVRQLQDPYIVSEVAGALEEVGLEPSSLILEITESGLVGLLADNGDKLRGLKDLGVRLAADDFGTGYSSLAYLKHLPLDLLKVDRAFVGGLSTDRVNTSIVMATVTLGHALGIEVVAEGVETTDEYDAVRTLECDIGQGNYWWAPRPAEEVEVLLDSDSAPHPNGDLRNTS